MIDYTKLKALAEAAKEWSNVTTVRDVPAYSDVCDIGHDDGEGNFYPVITVDCGQYNADSKPLAAYIAAASPDVVLALIARVAEVEKDAGRYRVLRSDVYQQHEDDISVSDSSFNVYFGEELDAAVDALSARYAAMGAQA